MRRISGRTLWLIFSCAVIVLVVIAVAADSLTARYASSEDWVSRTMRVDTWLIRLHSDLASAEAARLAFVSSHDPVELPLFEESYHSIPIDLSTLRELTADNLAQQKRIDSVRPLIEQRLGLLTESINLAKQNSAGEQVQQQKLTMSGAGLTQQIQGIINQTQTEEAMLLRQREIISDKTYLWERVVLAGAFTLTVFILAATFWTLLMELKERRQAEAVVRQLSGRLLKIQDEERRRIARELHDSLGQLLSSLKMNLDHMASHPTDGSAQHELLGPCISLAQEGIDETRTLSYLLHPPLLDEFGFASAAKWYIDGFVKRSKIDVKFDIAKHFERMPEEIELVLFRVLQESLTNIHRHSGSSTAEIVAERAPARITLRITDHGKGIPPEVLAKFRRTRGGVGVGLAGMRERIEQLIGKLDIRSEEHSTVLEVSIPIPAQSGREEKPSPPRPAAQDPSSRAATTSSDGGTTSANRAATSST